MNHKKILFSGIQPSGVLHLGGYIGAMKNWVQLQNEYDCLFSIVDLHAITVRQDPKLLRQRCYDFFSLYVACGLDPLKNIIFCQSHVPAHSELAWILNCYAMVGELNRMTQFKDKSQKYKHNINVGLFAYPVLQAADILLYQTDVVPVGIDQKQHLELAREIAVRFNNVYGETFRIPEPFIPSKAEGARIMSLQDPTKKMSKSDENEFNFISVLDAPELILKKLQRAVTDSGSEVLYSDDKPGVSNLLTIFSAISNKPIAKLEEEYIGSGYGRFKKELAEAIIEFLKPIQQRYYELRKDETNLHMLLRKNAERAADKAAPTLTKVHALLGFVP
jgi:tryptophanyl-tRNA synthetase